MYIVPHRAPAVSAAAMPRRESPPGARADDATARSVAPANIAAAPPRTPSQRARPASRSSLKSSVPQRMPSRLLAFQSGNAMESPICLIAKIVSVLETTRKRGPNHEVRRLTYVVPHGGGAAHQRGQAPARQEHAEHHNEGNDPGRDAERDELGGRLGGTEPSPGGEPGEGAHALEAAQSRRVELGYAIHRSTRSPARSTATGIQKWTSPSSARQRDTVVGCTGT